MQATPDAAARQAEALQLGLPDLREDVEGEVKPSKISWCDFSGGDLNFVRRGYTPGDCECSPGCENCYNLRIHARFPFLPEKTMIYADKLEHLIGKRFPKYSPKRGAPHKPMCFPCDTGDLFHENVPTDFIIHAFSIMAQRRDVSWLVLTKRPTRMNAVLFGEEGSYYLGGGDWYRNIRLMVSVENQQMADERIPELLKHWRGPNGVSVEPMLAAVDLRPWMMDGMPHDHHPKYKRYEYPTGALNWVICGAESGPNRRPFQVEWAEDLYDQCRAANVPYWFKQGSALRPGQNDELPNYGAVKEWPND